jgi:hypothetical protein
MRREGFRIDFVSSGSSISWLALGSDFFGQVRELLVGFSFLLLRLCLERHMFGFSQNVCELGHCALSRNFVFDPLRRTDQSRIHYGSVEIFVHDSAAIFYQSHHPLALLAVRAFT